MRRPWSTPGVTPDPRVRMETGWCIHETGAWPTYEWCMRNGSFGWRMRWLRFRNAMDGTHFETDNYLTWEWPPR